MSDIAIRVENLSKQYRIGQREPYKALRDILTDAMYAPFRRLWRHQPLATSHQPNHIWALKDVSFEVKHGEVVGIIGRNGAGKTTLLKVLSRITEPTEGYAEIHGRIGSLLEVGTGFHPELTGRENIYLNGAILGMKKTEIDRKFDEIVAFAEVEKFIDTPVKRYSSGMYVRLAFAVAAHMETEILLVDEVLAVGDAAFQKKCLGKMGDVAKAGKTVLFVSHSMPMILNLCNRCILLEAGRIALAGIVSKVVEKYLARAVPASTVTDMSASHRDGSGLIRIQQFAVCNDDGDPWLYPDRPAIFKMTVDAKSLGLQSSKVNIAIGVNNDWGERILELYTKFDKNFQENEFIFQDTMTIVCTTEQFPVRPGIYYLTLYIDYSNELSDRIQDGVVVEVRDTDYFGTGAKLSTTHGWYMLKQRWSCEK